MSNTIDFGIDLGTTNSAIAYYNNGEVVVFKNPMTLKETLPSVVAFKGERMIVGDKARELLQKMAPSVFSTFKRKMGTSEKYFIDSLDKTITPKELSSIVLKELKNFVHIDRTFSAVVITIPAAFDTVQSNATKKAGKMAGFDEVILLQEPIAASLAFANKGDFGLEENKWFVYDLGGGTFDVALTTIDDGEMKIVDHEGDNYLGGTDFDQAIIDQFIIPNLNKLGTFDNLESELKRSTGKYNRLYYKLLYLAEEAKKVLTHQPIAEIEFEVKDDTGTEIDVFLELSKAQFEDLIGGYIDSTVEMMKEIFSRNNLSEEEVNCILLIGGSTYIPLVKTKLREAFKIEINSSIDPSTAVVVGAAYYAGTKPLAKKIKPAPSIDQVTNNFKVKLAYERVVQDDEVLVLAKIDGAIEDLQYRITRADGGYDSGLLMLKNQLTMHLPIVENTFNSFEWSILNSFGEKIYTENIGVTHGKFSIDGQPLPHAICLEVDSIENDTTFLELVFKKNAILPLKKTITKQVSKTIRKGSTDYVIIKVLEGDVDALPAANKTIGIVRLDGMQLERDLIKGSDIDLTFEITESRDLKVNTYFSLTDQEFENTFNPSEINISKSLMLDELNSFKKNIQLKIKKFEESGNYESAGFTLELSKEIDVLIDKVNRLDENQNSDDIYRLEVKKRAMGKKIQTVFTTSFLTKAIEDYYKSKSIAEGILMTNEATEHDRMRFSKLIEHEKTLLKEGNITSIKMAVNQLDNITRTISRKQPLTSEDLLMHYIYMKHSSFKSQEKANELIRIGDHALENKNYIELHNIVNKLYILKEQDENENGDLFKNKGTGIK